MAGFTSQPLRHYDDWPDHSAPWQKWLFTTVCLTTPCLVVVHVAPGNNKPKKKQKTEIPRVMQRGSFCRRLFVFPVKLRERRGSVGEMERNASEETSEPRSERNEFVTVLSRGETYIQMCLLFFGGKGGGLISPLKVVTEQKTHFLMRTSRQEVVLPTLQAQPRVPWLHLSSHRPHSRASCV